jgi:hypothetical protein
MIDGGHERRLNSSQGVGHGVDSVARFCQASMQDKQYGFSHHRQPIGSHTIP